MARRNTKIQSDKAGNLYLDVPLDGGARVMRVGFSRWYFEPPLCDDGTVDLEAAAGELERGITGGTLHIQNLYENEQFRFPVEVELESKDDLEALIRAIRRVFKEGLKRNNTARLAGLEQCQERLTELPDVDERPERRRLSERRSPKDRRALERRRWYSPPVTDSRTGDRRAGPERRRARERRAA
ncbi:MAG: hypothetical protein JSW51_01840 [Gemmatimonadota bacterium]|nr:MAG: hypothetical protein JSW51_01840 [Gemmatimonadota bacterium]